MGFAGICTGAAYKDLKPVCEFMTFNCDAGDRPDRELRGEAGHMSNGDMNVPTRVPEARTARRRASRRSTRSGELVFPVPRAEGGGALQRRGRQGVAQGRDPGPEPRRVSENELLYGTSFPLSDEAQSKDFVLPLGKAHIEQEGTDVTLVTFSKMVGYCLDAGGSSARDKRRRCSI